MRCVLLGLPQLDHSWKNCVAEAAATLGWDISHLPARNIPTADVVRAAADADLLLWARTPAHDPDGDAAAMLRQVEDAGTITAGLHMDLYWSIPRREREIGRHPWWTCQYVFTCDGGPRPWAERGVHHYWLPPALGRRYLGRRPTTGRYPHRVVFTGSYSPLAHRSHRQMMLSWARRTYRGDFARYGGSRPVRGHELGDLYNSAWVVIGDSAPADYYWSDRVPCTLGRGGLLAHPRTKGLDDQGYDATVMLLYDRGCFADLAEQIAAVTERRRREITAAAIDLVRERHLWEHRLATIATTVGLS